MPHPLVLSDGDRLRLWRWAGGHTQREAAHLLGVYRGIVQKIEGGALALTAINDPAIYVYCQVMLPWLQFRLARYRARRRRDRAF